MRKLLLCCLCMGAVYSHATKVIVTVGSGGNFFSPASFTVNPGDTIKWVWVSGHHNVSGYSLPAGVLSLYSNMTSVDTVFEYVPLVSGLYKYTCTHHSGMDADFFVTGCSYPDKPVIHSANGNSGCVGDTIFLSTPPQTGATYQWLNGPFSVPFAVGTSLAATLSGNYKVVVNRCGMDSVSDVFPVVLHSPPAATFTYTSSGLDFVFSCLAPADSYTWKFSDGSPDQHTPQATISFATAGNYLISLQTLDFTTQCADSVAMTVTATAPVSATSVNRPPVLLYPNPADKTVCLPLTQLLNIVVTDIFGRRYSLPFSSQSADLNCVDISSLAEGMYYLTAMSEKASYTGSVVIAR